MDPKPTVGRIVHYADPAVETHLAAVVTFLPDPAAPFYVDLLIHGRLEDRRAFCVAYDPTGYGGTWHWPERD